MRIKSPFNVGDMVRFRKTFDKNKKAGMTCKITAIGNNGFRWMVQIDKDKSGDWWDVGLVFKGAQ